jgi:hypothetical protein
MPAGEVLVVHIREWSGIGPFVKLETDLEFLKKQNQENAHVWCSHAHAGDHWQWMPIVSS